MAVTLQELDLPGLEVGQHEGGVRRAKNLHAGKVASQDWDDALLRCGMQMRIDFINDHNSRLFGQIRRIAVVLGVTDEDVRQPLQDRLRSLAKDIEGNIPIERPKLGKQAVAVLGNTPELNTCKSRIGIDSSPGIALPQPHNQLTSRGEGSVAHFSLAHCMPGTYYCSGDHHCSGRRWLFMAE